MLRGGAEKPFKRTSGEMLGLTATGAPATMLYPAENNNEAKKPRVDGATTNGSVSPDGHTSNGAASGSRVVHIRNIPHEVTEAEVIHLGIPFGRITNVLVLKGKNQAFLEFENEAFANAMVNYFGSCVAQLRGRTVYVQFSNHKELKTDQSHSNANSSARAALQAAQAFTGNGPNPVNPAMGLGGAPPAADTQAGGPNTVLRVIVEHMLYPVTLDVLHQIFSRVGRVLKIITFTKNNTFQALIQYPDVIAAQAAKLTLDGQNIYNACCTLRIEYSKLSNLNVRYNNDKSRDYTNPQLPVGEPGDGRGKMRAVPLPFAYPPSPSMSTFMCTPPPPAANTTTLPLLASSPPLTASAEERIYNPNAVSGGGMDHSAGHPFGGQHHKQAFNGPAISIAGVMPGLGGLAQYTTPAAAAPGYPLGLMATHQGGDPSRLILSGSGDVTANLSSTLSAMNMVGMPLALGPSALSVATALGLPTPQGAGQANTVLLISNLNEEEATPEALFTLFGVYGDVQRVKILYNKKDSALIQMADSHQAQLAITHLDRVTVWGKQLRVMPSKHQQVQMPKEGQAEDLTKDFQNSPLHRFKRPGSKNFQNIHGPSSTLHLSNIPASCSEEQLIQSFKDQDFDVKAFKFFPNDHRMALIQLSSVEEAIQALIKLHNHQLSQNNHLRVSFSKSTIN
ncbi:unnamed protein product [Cyprideis torosa]|uniref:Uncharacterized protein n=1 Tax=Cyprideis torosa TaxID=163714 RepID=A0A7R8ZJB3_9CRUS|nr:unnamed protein product [Cyprideis torosa]CAG0881886.1 unnamed protein product [Cyprideis torosa]